MPRATSFSEAQLAARQPTPRKQRVWDEAPNGHVPHGRLLRMRSSTRAVAREADERLAMMRLLLPLAMVLILFTLWYAGMPLLPN